MDGSEEKTRCVVAAALSREVTMSSSLFRISSANLLCSH